MYFLLSTDSDIIGTKENREARLEFIYEITGVVPTPWKYVKFFDDGHTFLMCSTPDGINGIYITAHNYEVVEKIEKYAFLSCKNLKKLVIPSSVKFLDDKAFLNCDKLKIINNKKDYFCQLKITNCTNVNKVIELLKIKDYKIHQDEIILKEIKSDEYDAEDILYETIKDFIDKEEVILHLLETLNISFELSLSSLNKDYLGLFIVKQEITRFIYISKAKCINFDVF